MVIQDNILYLPAKELVSRFAFKAKQLDNDCYENRKGISPNYQHIKGTDPKFGRGINLIDYDTIPEVTRIEKGIPAKEILLNEIQENQVSSLVQFNNEAYNFYLSQPATSKVAKEKAEQASWFIAIASAKTNQVRALGFPSKTEFCAKAIELMNARASERHWHAWKLTTVAELTKRLTPFNKYLKGEITLAQACGDRISKKVGNSNAQKITLDQQAVMVQLFSDANVKPNFEQVWMIYTRKANEMIRLEHWNTNALISPSTVRAFLTKPAIKQLWYEARHGYQEYRNVFDPIIQRERATFANALWVIDGTPLHRYFQHLDKGKYFRWNIFIVLDAYSQCVLGFWISESEDTESVLGALRSACIVTGKMPTQILYDNGSAITSYRSQKAIDAISVVSFPAQAGNARTKVVEGYFHWFNENVEKFRPGFTHNPFAKRLDNRANREALALAVRNGNLSMADQALDQLITDLTLANNTPRKFLGGLSPVKAMRQSVEQTPAKQRDFTEAIDVEAFWMEPGEQKKIKGFDKGKPTTVKVWTPQEYPFTNRGFDIVINNNRFTYDIEDAAFRATHIGQKFTVKYEPNPSQWSNGQQPDTLLLYVQGKPVQWKGVHLAALPKQLMPMAIADYQQGTRAELDSRLSNKRTQRELVKASFNQMLEHTKQIGAHTDLTITENAFDKETLQDANADLLNQMIQGGDYRMSKTPELDGPTDDADEQYDRLSGYDEDELL